MSQEQKQFRRYKYTHLDADELRKRREDNSIMLRKQKRDEQLLKKRNVDLPHAQDNDNNSDDGSNMQDFNFNQGVSGNSITLHDETSLLFLCAYFWLFNFVHILFFPIIDFRNTQTFFYLKIKPIWEFSSFILKTFFLTL